MGPTQKIEWDLFAKKIDAVAGGVADIKKGLGLMEEQHAVEPDGTFKGCRPVIINPPSAGACKDEIAEDTTYKKMLYEVGEWVDVVGEGLVDLKKSLYETMAGL